MSTIVNPQQVAGPEGRASTYRLFATLLLRELTIEDVSALATVAQRAGAPATPAGLGAALAQFVAAVPAGGAEDALLDLAAEFARLFLGAGGPPAASPYESFYRGESRLFGPSAAEVQVLLDHWEVSYPTVLGPEDHLAVELLLMAALADRAGEAGGEEATSLAGSQFLLLQDRLLRWVPAFAERVQASTSTQFYKALAEVVRQFLSADAAFLQASMTLVKVESPA